MLKYFIILSIFVFCSCAEKQHNLNGEYSLSYSHPIGNDSVKFPEPENSLVIKNDSIFYFEFENYIAPIVGIIKNDSLIFNNGVKYRFTFEQSKLKTFDDSLCFEWFIRK